MSTEQPQNTSTRLEVVCETDTGRVIAASPAKLRATGVDGPTEAGFVPRDGQVLEEIELTPEQLSSPLLELFASHVVSNGRLVPPTPRS